MRRLFLFWRQGGRDIRVLWRALRHPDRPKWLLPAAAALAFFALDPLNLALPLMGAVDELVLLPLALQMLTRALPAHLRGARRAKAVSAAAGCRRWPRGSR